MTQAAIDRYHLGCPLWKHKPWVEELFSSSARPADFLTEYASVFNAVEGNTTFYGFPAAETVRKWAADTPEGFKFCFKMPQVITHEKRLRETEADVDRFFELLHPVRERVGPIMIQLGTDFSVDELEHLDRFLGMLPLGYSYAVEVRHPDLFDHGRKEHRLNLLLRSYNADRVIFDTRRLHQVQSRDPDFRAVQRRKPQLPVRFETTGSRPLVRYVGSNEPEDNRPYLKEWAIIVADWIKEGLHPYVFIHAPDEFYAPRIARLFHNLLHELIDLNPMPRWPAQRERDSQQLNLF